jgi:hypothetical protein
MPHWCENELKVSGRKEVLERFRVKANHVRENGQEKVLSFEPFLPRPRELKSVVTGGLLGVPGGRYREHRDENGEIVRELVDEQALVAKYGAADWYIWSLQNWGTKWDAYYSEVEAWRDNELFYRFQTAWSPPEPVIVEMSRQFPELEFELRYLEAGIGFHGILCCQGGDVTLQECRLNVTI